MDEVSRRLSPAENPSSIVPTLPSGLQKVPVTGTGSQSSSSAQVTDLIASTVVQGSLADVSAAVTGLVPSTSEGPPSTPGQCFQSVSLPVDARVSEKLREKIWKDEFVDFGCLLANPVLANRFQCGYRVGLKTPPKDTVSDSTRAVNVPRPVHTNTSAINVVGHTRFQIVIFVAQPEQLDFSPNLPSPSPPDLPTPVRVERLGFLLDGYTHSTVEFLISAFTRGFSIHFQGEGKSRAANNLLSALENPSAVDAKLRKELEAHRLAGPFQSLPLSPFWISPLGIVPKKFQVNFA